LRIGQHLAREVHEGLGELERIDRLWSLGLVAFGEVGQELLAARGNVLEGGLHLVGLGGRQAREDLLAGRLRHAFPLLNQWLWATSCDTWAIRNKSLYPPREAGNTSGFQRRS